MAVGESEGRMVEFMVGYVAGIVIGAIVAYLLLLLRQDRWEL